MAKGRLTRVLDATRRAGPRAGGCNCRVPHGMGARGARNKKSFKTKPIVPSLPNGAARCAFARSGAQRARTKKSEERRFFSRRQEGRVALRTQHSVLGSPDL